MRRIQILALAAGLALAVGATAPAIADPVDVSDGSSSYAIQSACSIFQADYLVDEGEPDDPEDDVYEHVNVYVCGGLYDDDGDGTADRASALAARFVDGHEEERYSGDVAVSDVTVDTAGGTASVAATVPSVLSTGAESCTIGVDFAATGEAVAFEGGGDTLAPATGDGLELRLITNSNYSGSDTPAAASGTACGWAELASEHEGNSAEISEYHQDDSYTAVNVSV